MPHPGHCLTRAIKDVFPRYRTMRGYRCERKAGWDTHGLPVEVEVCKELGIHSKEEIENFGIEPFIQKCQQSVWRYMKEWERLTDRIGFWVDLKNAYATYHQSYVESVWWSLKELFNRDLLYQGHKIVWWWAQGGTALSSGEVGEGYRSVADPSVYVKFPLLDDAGKPTDTSLLVWTTTPWTLPSNHFVAINPRLTYSIVIDHETGEKLVVAEALVQSISAKLKRELATVETRSGFELIEQRYKPPFDFYWNQRQACEWYGPDALRYLTQEFTSSYEHVGPNDSIEESEEKRIEKGKQFMDAHPPDNGWQIIMADFVTTDAGTGLVHIAPALGEDDMHVSGASALLHRARASFAKRRSFRWQIHSRRSRILPRPLGQRLRQRHRPRSKATRPIVPPRTIRPRLPLLPAPNKTPSSNTRVKAGSSARRTSKTTCSPTTRRSTGSRSTSKTAASASSSKPTSTGPSAANATGARRSPSGNARPPARWKPSAATTNFCPNRASAAPKSGTKPRSSTRDLPDDLRIHKPYIDEIVYDSPFEKGAHMRRVPEVIDCWYDAGSMPFAQWGYRGEHPPGEPASAGGKPPALATAAQKFHQQFPADFISEAIDQTRGWFYAQLAISTLMFGVDTATDKSVPGSAGRSSSPAPSPQSPVPYPHPFRNCIVLGHMLGEDGLKMSKRKRNYLPPDEIFDRYGADALRWYFFANQPPWTSIRYSEQAIKDSIPEFLLRLWNVYSFFVIYANIDGFDPRNQTPGEPASAGGSAFANEKSYRPITQRNELDRWILSELNRTCAAVVERMDAYDNFGACQHITAFVDALSNWYVRRSRDRFWAADKRSAEKLDAYWTLYDALLTTTKLVAPFVPFLAETLWQNLAGALRNGANTLLPAESVHLCDYPSGDAAAVDEDLSVRMNLVREIASLGRNARNAANLKVRQPLAKVEVVLVDTTHQKWLEEHVALIADELNVKAVEFTTHGEQYISYSVAPNFKRLGPRLGKHMPAAKKALGEIDAAKLLDELKSAGNATLTLPSGETFELDNEDIEVRLAAKEGWAAAQGKGCVVVLSTELTPELMAEGLVRDIVRLIQDRRKEIGCEYTDRIEIGLVSSSVELTAAIEKFRDYLAQETLAVKVVCEPPAGIEPVRVNVAGNELAIYVRVVK